MEYLRTLKMRLWSLMEVSESIDYDVLRSKSLLEVLYVSLLFQQNDMYGVLFFMGAFFRVGISAVSGY